MILVDSQDQIFVHTNFDDAQKDIDALKKAGYEDKEITMIITSGETVLERFTLDNPPKGGSEPRVIEHVVL
jgi:hypothetical protein